MFVPLHDRNPIRHLGLPYVTWGLIAANVFIFVVFLSGVVFPGANATFVSFGMIPAVYNDLREIDPTLVSIPDGLTLISYQFLHGGWMHLISNMLFLWVFGDNVEDAIGHIKFLVFYLLCGMAGGYAHLLSDGGSVAPLIGASGAVAGVIGAYLVLHPKVQVWVLALGRIPLLLPAWVVLGFWIGMQFFSILTATDGSISWWAHVGGAIAGAILIVFFRRPGIPLLDRGLA